MKAVLPLKTRMLQYGVQKNGEFTLKDIMEALKPEYGDERMFTKKRLQEYFDALVGVGFFRDSRLELDENGELIIHAVVTDYGRDRAKYIPEN